MGTPQQLKRPGRIGVQCIGIDFEGFAPAHELRLAGGLVRKRPPAHQVALQLLGVALPVAGLDLEQPVVGKTLFNTSEILGAFTVGIRPLGGGIHRALEMGAAAIAVIQRQLAKARAVGIDPLIVDTGVQSGVVGQIRFADAIEHVLGRGIAIDKGTAIFVGGDDTSAQCAVFRQRPGQIQLAAIAVP